jgi:hypothetical protein
MLYEAQTRGWAVSAPSWTARHLPARKQDRASGPGTRCCAVFPGSRYRGPAGCENGKQSPTGRSWLCIAVNCSGGMWPEGAPGCAVLGLATYAASPHLHCCCRACVIVRCPVYCETLPEVCLNDSEVLHINFLRVAKGAPVLSRPLGCRCGARSVASRQRRALVTGATTEPPSPGCRPPSRPASHRSKRSLFSSLPLIVQVAALCGFGQRPGCPGRC